MSRGISRSAPRSTPPAASKPAAHTPAPAHTSAPAKPADTGKPKLQRQNAMPPQGTAPHPEGHKLVRQNALRLQDVPQYPEGHKLVRQNAMANLNQPAEKPWAKMGNETAPAPGEDAKVKFANTGEQGNQVYKHEGTHGTSSALGYSHQAQGFTSVDKPNHVVSAWGKAGAEAHLGKTELKAEHEGRFGKTEASLTGHAGAKVGVEGAAISDPKHGKVMAAGSAEVGVGAKVDGEVKHTVGPLEAKLTGSAQAGAHANANADFGVDLKQGKLGGAFEANAFAGVKASATGSVQVLNAKLDAGVTGYAGVGAEFKAHAKVEDARFKFGAQGGAALGAGVGGHVNVEIPIPFMSKKLVEKNAQFGSESVIPSDA